MSRAIDAISNLSFWSGSVELEPLSGGLSNESFVVTDVGDKFVARFGLDIPVHHVIRTREVEISRAAAELGISPKLHYAEEGIMIFDYIEGHTFSPLDLRNNLQQGLELVKQCHNELHYEVRGPGYIFWVFHVLRDYTRLLLEGNSHILPNIPRLALIAEELEKSSGNPKICCCHSDLLAANFIDDGDRLWLIDWEYGGFGNAWFDVGNMAAISDFSRDEEFLLLSSYLEHEPNGSDWRRFDAMRCAANLREAMWGMVSEIYMDFEIDYETYTRNQLDMFEKSYEVYADRYDLK